MFAPTVSLGLRVSEHGSLLTPPVQQPGEQHTKATHTTRQGQKLNRREAEHALSRDRSAPLLAFDTQSLQLQSGHWPRHILARARIARLGSLSHAAHHRPSPQSLRLGVVADEGLPLRPIPRARIRSHRTSPRACSVSRVPHVHVNGRGLRRRTSAQTRDAKFRTPKPPSPVGNGARATHAGPHACKMGRRGRSRKIAPRARRGAGGRNVGGSVRPSLGPSRKHGAAVSIVAARGRPIPSPYREQGKERVARMGHRRASRQCQLA